MVTNPRFVNFATALAEKEGIPFQIAVRSGGGTNGGCIHIVGDSIPVIVISVPVRYIHSPNGIASYEDFDNVVKLAVTILKNLTGDIIDSF
jgi:putative aminopeptidase FrvX